MRFDESDNSLPNDFDTMELIGDHMIQIGVPRYVDIQLKKNIIAATKTYFLRNKSLDYTLKKYGDAWAFQEPCEEELFSCYVLRESRHEIEKLFNRHAVGKKSLFPEHSDHIGFFAAETALARLRASFRCASILLGQYCSFEASTICRIILEQLAWAYKVHDKIDMDKIIKLKPPKSINTLKDIIPYAGKLYGKLSCLSHLDPEFNRHYIGFEEECAYVKLSSLEDTKLSLYYYILLCDALGIIMESICHRYFEQLNYVRVDANKIYLQENRPLSGLLDKVERKFINN